MLRWILALGTMLCLTVSAAAQTTRPVPAGWTQAVSDFATAVNSADNDAAQALLADQVDIHTFSSAQGASLKLLIDFASAQTLVDAHGYLHPPVTLAADIAADAAACDIIPPEAKQSLVSDGPAAAKASEIAVKWVTSTLNANSGTLVGVITFWDLRVNGTPDNPVHPFFILIKGAQTDSGKFAITTIVFGDPISTNAE
jgi:hypothetical protein